MSIDFEPIKPLVGGIAHIDKRQLTGEDAPKAILAALEERGVLVFPRLGLTDEEQLDLTDRLGGRVNFTRRAPGSDVSAKDIYTITLDREINKEPDYILGTFFWHIDGLTMDMPLPKATLLSARRLSDTGGATEFANLYAAYEGLPDDEKQEIEHLRAIHTLEASVRSVFGIPPADRVERWSKMAPAMEHPLVWTHEDNRRSLLLGSHADGIVGYPGAHGRALLQRLQQWASQPDFVYRHKWQEGDFLIWNNQGLMHRVIPYTDERREMHRTTILGTEHPGRIASSEALSAMLETVV